MRTVGVSVLFAVMACPLLAAEPIQGKLLVNSLRTGTPSLFLVDLVTGDATNLAPTLGAETRYPMFSGDGRKIAFTAKLGGTFNLCVQDSNGGKFRQLTRETGADQAYMPNWSQDGKHIIFGLIRGLKTLMAAMSPDGADFRVFGEGLDPCISPDGKTVVFTRRHKKGSVLYACDADGKNVRQLTDHENDMGAMHPFWSSDGKRIVYGDQVDDHQELFTCDPDGKNVRQLTKLGMIASSACYSPDGRWIAFRVSKTAFWKNAKESQRVYREKPADMRPVWIMKADGSEPHIVEMLHYQIALDGSRTSWNNSTDNSVAVEPYHEPQVRYILADIQLGGSVDYYGKWAKEGDPDSARAVKEWQAGTRVQNIASFQRKTVAGKFGKGMRIVYQGTNRTIDAMDVVLTKDLTYRQADVRYLLADLTLGLPVDALESRKSDPSVREALSRWADGVRAANKDEFEIRGTAKARQVVYKGSQLPIDGMFVKLNSDLSYEEGPVRYILADMQLGGSPDFYRHVLDTSHDPISAEALARFDSGYQITNLDQFERKKVAGKTLITYKGTDQRIDGKSVTLSSDRQ
jgi:TolB protein